MAAHWSLKRSMQHTVNKIPSSDASEHLRIQLAENTYLDVTAVNPLMNSLGNTATSVKNISAAIQCTNATREAAETLVHVLENEKKLKETRLKVLFN